MLFVIFINSVTIRDELLTRDIIHHGGSPNGPQTFFVIFFLMTASLRKYLNQR